MVFDGLEQEGTDFAVMPLEAEVEIVVAEVADEVLQDRGASTDIGARQSRERERGGVLGGR